MPSSLVRPSLLDFQGRLKGGVLLDFMPLQSVLGPSRPTILFSFALFVKVEGKKRSASWPEIVQKVQIFSPAGFI